MNMKNIVLIEWYDNSTNLTYTAVDMVPTESDAIKVAMSTIKHFKSMGVEAIASPIDRRTLDELITKGLVSNEWYDPIKQEYCTLNA